MKKILLLVLTAIIIMVSLGELAAQSPFSKKKPVPATRGKASVKELGQEIYNTLQTGRVDRLMVYLPSDKELKELKKHDRTHEKTQELLETLSAEQLESKFEQDLNAVQSQLAAQAVSPAMATLETISGGRSKIPGVIPVTVTLLDDKQQPVSLTFESIRIGRRVFLLRDLQVQEPSEMQASTPKVTKEQQMAKRPGAKPKVPQAISMDRSNP